MEPPTDNGRALWRTKRDDDQMRACKGRQITLNNTAKRTLRILALMTDAHGSMGGIAQYNRDLLEALDRLDTVGEIVVLPRIAPEPVNGVPAKVIYNLKGLGGKIRYLLATVELIWSIKRFDLIYCAHVSLMPVGRVLSRLFRIPLVLAIYGIDAWSPHSSWLVRRTARRCDLILSISHITLDKFRSWSDRTGAGSEAIIPNAIRLEDYGAGQKNVNLATCLGLNGKHVVMTLGRLSDTERYKGFDEILDLLPRLRTDIPDIAYLVVGDGPDRRRLEAKAKRNGVADITVFAGKIPQAQKADYYRLADAYVMPSYGEGFGFAILEALACGVPVVASKMDGTSEAVRNGELGLLVDPHDPNDIRQAIIAALQAPKYVPEGLTYFSFDRFSERLRKALGQVINI